MNCFQTNSQTLEATFTSTGTTDSYSSIKFSVSKLTNNWYSGTNSIAVKTTINDPTYYYVESGSAVVNFAAGFMLAQAANNEKIILLENSEISLTLTAPFSLTRVTSTALLKITVSVPNQLTLIANTCSSSYSNSVCAQSGQVLTLTSFDNFPSPITLTFNATASYFL